MPTVHYGDNAGNACYSPAIWGHMPIEQDPSRWVVFEDHFTGGLDIAASGSQGKWYAYIDTSDTITTSATLKTGAAIITTAATDNNSPTLAGGITGALFTPQAMLPLAFEARIAVSSIATMSIFVGIAQQGLAVNNGLIADTQTAANIADVDYIGFWVLGDTAASTVNAAYHTESGTAVNVKAAAHTLVANSYVNLGFFYNPYWDRFYFYVDGVKVAGQTTMRIGTTGVPDGEEMTPYLMLKNGSGAARTLTCDFIRVAQAIW